mmetsp:Transcript_8637/g.12293  ORF Transcript_8637/g.12293 Transcript_8637/m.12293 type:complete len:625 (+) Transcript_8637:77-1951(+)
MEYHTPTIGERLDRVIATIESIPATYRVSVAICFIFAFALLNIGPSPNVQYDPKKLPSDDLKSSSLSESKFDEPQPKWHILKYLNIAAALSFLISVFYFLFDASTYLNDSNSMLKFLAGWSAFLCYFFGFFGISFIDADELVGEEQKQNQHEIVKTTKLQLNPIVNKRQESLKPKSVAIHPPKTCTPVCSDPPSTSKKCDNQPSPEDLKKESNETIANMVLANKIKDHLLEKLLDPHRAVDVRRIAFDSKLSSLGNGGALSELPSQHSLDYSRVYGANCEVVVGYVPIPVGMVGPLTLNGKTVYIPMATTEGCLVASTNRGCKAITQGSGAQSCILNDGITRAPCVRMPSAFEAANLKLWCEEPENFQKLKAAFESTTSFGKLLSIKPTVAGKCVHLRLQCFSGDAMGMNMVSKGSLAVIDLLQELFPNLKLVGLSGNMCTDKKAAAINWIEGRGKSVVVEATIPKDVVSSTLKTSVKSIVNVNRDKNLVGSAMAGAIGGFNAHASNLVTAVFLATGQDPAQNVESSNCITLLEETEEGDLWISCTMPSIEVGTVGGGTSLPAQSACLKAIGCKGGGLNPGDNAKQLAHIVASATMAGELSLLAALSANHLVKAHMQHNRKTSK